MIQVFGSYLHKMNKVIYRGSFYLLRNHILKNSLSLLLKFYLKIIINLQIMADLSVWSKHHWQNDIHGLSLDSFIVDYR